MDYHSAHYLTKPFRDGFAVANHSLGDDSGGAMPHGHCVRTTVKNEKGTA
jgi:hypothetical protein